MTTGEATLVYGLNRGDEGKGRFTDAEAAEHEVVARFGGGQNAGHTVLAGETELALSLVPSGIMHDGVYNVVGNGCVVDPVKALTEFKAIRIAGVEINPERLFISSAAHLVLPHHIEADRIREGGHDRQGTTKSGIAQVYAAKHLRVGRRMEDANNALAELAQAAKEGLRSQLEARKAAGLDDIDIDVEVERYVEATRSLGPYVTDTSLFLHKRMIEGDNVLAEGAQGFLLDIDHGMYPFTTSSGTAAAAQGLGIPANRISRVVGVAKLTQSHVGGGPFVTEVTDEETLQRLRGKAEDVDGEYGTVTGRPRRMGHLDIPGIRRAQMINGDTEMAVTKLDLVPRYGENARICTSYERKGRAIDIAPDAGYKLEQCTPIYADLPTWSEVISDTRDFEDLPKEAQHYIEFIEQQTGVPITMIGVGPDREQVIKRPKPV